MKIQKICKYCKKSFLIHPSKIKEGRGKYCSLKCSNKIALPEERLIELYESGLPANKIAEYFNVSHNTAFRRLKELGLKLKNGGYYSGGQFKKGQTSWRKGVDNRIVIICKVCEKSFKVHLNRKNKAKFCSFSCGAKDRFKIPWNKGKHHSKESIKKMRIAQLGKKYSKKTKEKKRLSMLKIWSDPEFKIKRKELFNDPIIKNKMRQAQLKVWSDPEYKKKHSQISKDMWLNKNFREKIIKASLKGLLKRPTSLEQQMIGIIKKYNLPYKYTGDGSFLIGYKNPDFINVNGEKKLIEVGNIFHHQGNYVQERRNHFAKYGWKSYIFITQKLSERKILKELKGGY